MLLAWGLGIQYFLRWRQEFVNSPAHGRTEHRRIRWQIAIDLSACLVRLEKGVGHRQNSLYMEEFGEENDNLSVLDEGMISVKEEFGEENDNVSVLEEGMISVKEEFGAENDNVSVLDEGMISVKEEFGEENDNVSVLEEGMISVKEEFGEENDNVSVLDEGMISVKEMSRQCMIFDRSDCSERVLLFHVRDFSISACEDNGFQYEGNGFNEVMALGVSALENARFSGGLSIPLLEEEFSWVSSSSEAAASMAVDNQQQQQVERADDKISNCYSLENGDEVDALLDLGDNLADTADSMEVQDHRSQRIRETFEKLRDIVGGDWMDPVDVLDEAIRCVKRLESERQL